MRRATAWIVLTLLLLATAAFLLHGRAREEKAKRLAPDTPATPGPSGVESPVAGPETAIKENVPSPRPVVVPPGITPHVPRAVIQGKVKISGAAPRRRRRKVDSDPECVAMHPAGLLMDDIVVDEEKNVRWAFVYVADGIKDAPKGILAPLLLDQVGCRFDPHVLGVQVNQAINIYNNDHFLHNVHASATVNREFNFGLLEAGQYETKTFNQPEIMVKVRCDVHPWMLAWIGVLDHPYFCVTSETGAYGIRDIPPGTYLVKVWHERYATVSRWVDIPSGGHVELDLILDAMKE